MGTETKPQYSPGLAGVIAGETAICWVDPAAGLMYRGYDIHGMAEKATFEGVAYLLLNGELPNAKQLKDFTRQIGSERGLPGPVTEMLRLLPSDAHPMDMLRTGVSMLSAFDKDLNDNSHDANIRKAIRLIARDLGKRTGKENWVPICETLEQVMEREKQLCANVDLYAAPVFWLLGFPPELNTPLFAASRVAGWCAHVIEQHDNNRLIRPRSLYVGPELRPYPGSPGA